MDKLYFVLFFQIFFPNNAYAYIDPGSGGLILQFLIAIIAGIASFRLVLKQKIKSLFKKKIDKNLKVKNNNKD